MSDNLWQETKKFYYDKKDFNKFVEFYPLYLQDENYYNLLHLMLSVDKSKIPKKEILKSSYLKFLLFGLCEQKDFQESIDLKVKGNEYINHVYRRYTQVSFRELLSHIMRVSFEDLIVTYKFNNETARNKESCELTVSDIDDIRIIIGNIIITETDFEKIRLMLLDQNGISIDYIKEYNPLLESRKNIYYGKTETATFDESVESLCCEFKKFPYEIKDKITFYTFNKMLQRKSISIRYKILQPLLVSGQIKLKNDEDINWCGHIPNRGRYDDILISQEEFDTKGLGSICMPK